MEVPEEVCSKENECAKAQEDNGETEAVQQCGVEEENKSDWALPSTVGQVDDLAPTSGDEEILSPIEHEAPSPFREREEKSRTPDSEDPMSSDEGGGGGFPSLLLRRLPPDGHEFPTAYSEPSLPKAPPPPSATSSAPSSQEDALPLKKPMHVYEDSGIFSDDPLSSLSASEGEEKTKVSVTKSPKECCSRQGDGRAAVSGEEAPWTNGVDKDSTSSPPPPTMIAAEPPPAAAMPKEDTKCLPATFASTPLPTPTAQYSSPLILDRRASAEATQKRYSGMLASMLETTKFGTKLKGLVIPDKPKAPATVAKTLPVIVSNSVVPSSNKMVSAMDDCKLRRDSKHSPPSPKHTTLLADPPWKTKEVSEVPKYSPAFKRRSLQVSKSCDVSPVRGSSQNGFQFSLSHSKPVTPVLPETPVMSPPPLSYTSSGSRSRSNSSSSTFSNPSSSGCSLEIAKKSRADSYAMSDGEQKQAPTVVAETPVANGKPYGQSPLLERYLSSATYDEKNAEAKVSRQNSVKSVSSTDSRSDQKTITNGYDGPSAKYNSERRSSAEIQRKNSLGSADAVIQEAKAQTVSASSSPPQLQRLPSTETKCDESRKAARTWDASSLKDAKTKYRSMDDRSWNSQFRRNSCEQPVYSTRVNSASSLSADQRTRSMDLKESPSEAWQKSVRASQLGQQKTVLKKTIDSADSAKSFKALAQKWEQRSQDAQAGVPQAQRKDMVVSNGKSHPPVAPKPPEYNRQSQYIVANGKASPSTSADYPPPVQLRSQRYPLSRPASMFEERDKPRLSTDWPESHPSSYLRTKVDRPSSSVAYRSSKNCSPSLSVNDIKKAFENESAKVPPRTLASLRAIRSEQQLPLPEHRRFSSIDSNDSGNSTASREQYSSMTSLASTSSLISPQELQQLIDEANQSLDEAGASGHDIHVVILHKDSPTSGVGVTLAGGSDYETKEITVHKVIAGGLADRDGRIRKADRILSINGKTMKNVTHKDAIDILKSPRQEVVLVISRDGRQSLRTTPNISRASSLSSVLDVVDEPDVSASASPVTEAQQSPTPAKHEKIVLVKDGLGLGFTLEGGKDSPLGDKPLVVKRIFRGGAAERDGRLLVGDELVSINAQPVCLMTRTEAWNFLKKLPDGPLTLQVVRRAC
ncbi:pro-interleukin-16 isoform X2 [Rhipicephalus sanguineus]|uniref:pro-interleukin-16 isoform X2 n=1 Tax=Rhipicephalus sanguineus TaxID=34632 RepID=UPI0020C44B93|nr:pro-interleukin-16 isoform X2 [Rhipicephalus sanguineus]